MYNHAPTDYKCPICLGVQGIENEDTLLRKSDVVYKDNLVTVFINSFFIKNNPGHVIVIPNEHFENIYYLPTDVGRHIFDTAQKIAKVLKEVYGCEGITFLQNNEPAGDQHAFHYHLHVFPRYDNDELTKYLSEKRLADPKERSVYADKLRAYFSKDSETSSE